VETVEAVEAVETVETVETVEAVEADNAVETGTGPSIPYGARMAQGAETQRAVGAIPQFPLALRQNRR